MKIIFLNTLNGKIREKISEFIKLQAKDTDIFCFQEAHDDMKKIARGVLPGFEEFSGYKPGDEEDDFEPVTYIRKTTEIISFGVILENQENIGLGIYQEIKNNNKNIFITNFHGDWIPGDKLDNPNRILQSESIINFWKDKPGLKVIGGDFNLLPETESIKIFEKNGYKDLIKEYKIPTTRNQLAWELYPDNKQLFSDYVFLSPDVKCKNLTVLENEISDHLPMILEIEQRII